MVRFEDFGGGGGGGVERVGTGGEGVAEGEAVRCAGAGDGDGSFAGGVVSENGGESSSSSAADGFSSEELLLPTVVVAFVFLLLLKVRLLNLPRLHILRINSRRNRLGRRQRRRVPRLGGVGVDPAVAGDRGSVGLVRSLFLEGGGGVDETRGGGEGSGGGELGFGRLLDSGRGVGGEVLGLFGTSTLISSCLLRKRKGESKTYSRRSRLVVTVRESVSAYAGGGGSPSSENGGVLCVHVVKRKRSVHVLARKRGWK